MQEDFYKQVSNKEHFITFSNFMDKLKKIEMLALDIDGTLTNGSMYLTPSEEMKQFSTQDGMGISLLRNIGIKVVIVTTSLSKTIEKRAEMLKIDELVMHSFEKDKAISVIAKKLKVNLTNTLFLGDDINDIPAFQSVGIPVAVLNAVPAIIPFVLFQTLKQGGKGAVREICDYILYAKTNKLYGYPYIISDNVQ